jgi:methylmalonyl-CoA mutase N-terminal domain/subunit
VAKYRAARRLWARVMRDRFGARNPKSWQLRFHAQTAGVSLTAQQPMNNVVGRPCRRWRPVLGGTQSLHTNALDEALALPTAERRRWRCARSRVLAFESGVTDVVDPLGGSYAIEQLTTTSRPRPRRSSTRSTRAAAWWRRIEQGFPQREIAESAYRRAARHRTGEPACGGRHADGRRVEHGRHRRLHDRRRGGGAAAPQLAELRSSRNAAAVGDGPTGTGPRRPKAGRNTMPAILDAVRAYATVGEMCDALRRVWGEYEEVPIV